jgi:hypothetical protein
MPGVGRGLAPGAERLTLEIERLTPELGSALAQGGRCFCQRRTTRGLMLGGVEGVMPGAEGVMPGVGRGLTLEIERLMLELGSALAQGGRCFYQRRITRGVALGGVEGVALGGVMPGADGLTLEIERLTPDLGSALAQVRGGACHG